MTKCRECGDTAHYCVIDKDKGIMPWYYCPDCVELMEELGSEAKFTLIFPRPMSQEV